MRIVGMRIPVRRPVAAEVRDDGLLVCTIRLRPDSSLFLSGSEDLWCEVEEKRRTTVMGLTSICVRRRSKVVFSLAMRNGNGTICLRPDGSERQKGETA